MESRRFVALATGTLLIVLLGAPALADDPEECSYSIKPEAKRIEVCSRLIASGRLSGQKLANAHQERGEAYRTKGDYDRAIADFSSAIQLDPNSDTSRFHRASVYYFDKHDYDGAIADLSEAMRIKPRFSLYVALRGEAYEKKGDRDKALADFRSALAIDPDDKYAKEGLARWTGVAWLGLGVQEVTEEVADAYDIKPPRGAFVSEVNERGPAKPAGIEPHDVIVTFDGDDVAVAADLPRLVAARPIGKEVEVTLIRGGLKEQKYVTLARREDAGQPPQAAPAGRVSGQPQPPLPRTATAPAPATVKGLFERYDLIGAFAADCSLPVSAQNAYVLPAGMRCLLTIASS
jgi:tetratricopeptide (TPR) repeat protein